MFSKYNFFINIVEYLGRIHIISPTLLNLIISTWIPKAIWHKKSNSLSLTFSLYIIVVHDNESSSHFSTTVTEYQIDLCSS